MPPRIVQRSNLKLTNCIPIRKPNHFNQHSTTITCFEIRLTEKQIIFSKIRRIFLNFHHFHSLTKLIMENEDVQIEKSLRNTIMW